MQQTLNPRDATLQIVFEICRRYMNGLNLRDESILAIREEMRKLAEMEASSE